MSSDDSAAKGGPLPPRVPSERPGQVGGKRDQNRRRRIKQICDGALPLMLEHGIETVTVDQIVAGAKVAKGSFYRYFRDKTELVETMFAPLAEAFRAAVANCEQKLAATTDPETLPAIYLQLAIDLSVPLATQQDLVRLYLQENRGPAVGARAPVRALADEITEGGILLSAFARDHQLLADSDPRIGALTVIGAVERILFGFLSGDDLGSPADIPRTLIALILDGVRFR